MSHADGCTTLRSKWKTPRGARTIERVDDGKGMRSAKEWPGVPRHGVGRDAFERDEWGKFSDILREEFGRSRGFEMSYIYNTNGRCDFVFHTPLFRLTRA